MKNQSMENTENMEKSLWDRFPDGSWDRRPFRKICCMSVLCTALLFTACQAEDTQTPNDGVVESVSPEDVQTPDSTEAAETEPAAAPDTEPSGEEEANTADAPEESSEVIISSQPATSVSITMQTPDKTELSDDNGTLYYTSEYSYPVVSIEGNDASADKINADILAEMDNLYAAGETTADDALEWLQSIISDGDSVEDFFRAYSVSASYNIQRADDSVISFTIYTYTDMGGAHGDYTISGVTYDTQTGEQLTLSELSGDPDAFHSATLAYNQALAQTEAFSERMYTTDDITNGTLENVLYAEGAWYLSEAGLVFFSNPYALGPYASGAIEFIIPYKDLADMGFKEQYGYSGRMIMPLEEKQELTVDLNGDGAEDTLFFYSESAYSDDGSYKMANHLTINGTDFADTVAETLPADAWASIALYDLNTDDEYLDIALLVVFADGDTYTPHSFFFRYETDGALTYLGKVKDDVTDPAAAFTELTP